MVLLIDSREQSPIEFPDDHLVVSRKVEALPVGDYMCEGDDGYRLPVSFERKSVGDLFGTMTSGYKRFKREILKAHEERVQLILIVEATLSKVYRGYEYSNWPGESVVRKMFTLWMRYEVMPVFCDGRAEMAAYMLEMFKGMSRSYVGVKAKAVTGRHDGSIQAQ